VTRLTNENPDALNTLSGYAFIVRTIDGASAGYNATAIANFSRSGQCIFNGAGSELPTLFDGDDGLAQLEFALSKANISQGYSLEDSILGKFAMVVTFPTKHFHFFGKNGNPQSDDPIPYEIIPDESISLPFTGLTSNLGEPVRAQIYDRLENVFSPTTSPFSPRVTEDFVLPHEVTILGLYKDSPPSDLPKPGERNTVAATTGTPGFDSGWIWIDLTKGVNDSGITHFAESEFQCFDYFGYCFPRYDGLPVIAFGFQEFRDATVGGFYGDMFPAFYDVDWVIQTLE